MLKRKIAVFLLGTTMIFTTSINAFASSTDGWTEASQTSAGKYDGAWDKWVKSFENAKDPLGVSLTPGKNASEINFAWYSKNAELNPKFKFGKNQDLSDAKEIAVNTEEAVNGYKSNKVTVTGLEKNSVYYYSYQVSGLWRSAISFKTQDTKSFSFLYVGDPQIGSSSSNIATGATGEQGQYAAVMNDSFNWNNTLNTALKVHPNISFMVSAGDQIQTSKPKSNEQDIEYAGFLRPDVLRSLPVATTIGNHDSNSPNYSYHFNNPNTSDLGLTKAGGDYYYSYGNTLFITLNTNNKNMAEHKQVIEKAINENKDAKWRIVTIHHDIYGSGEHSNEPEIVSLRYSLIPILEENKIDVVLTGHDHTYSRSLILKGGKADNAKIMNSTDFYKYYDDEIAGKDTPNEYKEYLKSIEDPNAVQNVREDVTYKNGNVVDPSGILYMTANSASGSKYYDLIQHQQSYIAARWQQDIPTYSKISVDEVSFTINTYRTDNGEKIDNTFSIIKSIDKAKLNQLIAIGDNKVSSKDNYTPSSFSNLENQLVAAKGISSKASATSKEIADAYTNLKNTIDNIEVKGDKTELKALIDKAETLLNSVAVGTEKGQYPVEAQESLRAAIELAKGIMNSPDSNQLAVDNALNNLDKVLNDFSTKVVKDAPEVKSLNVKTIGKVKTGDEANVYPFIAVVFITLAGLVYGIRSNKHKEAR
ncbi:purple acid phosphatase family protein [Clostridium cibarium]|uniref:Metallophosphoesterase family protein n=1 Tax=Clostridium cibarium TaxID=2762247 RepID=A0ABR8PSI9_9CLOT|nr:metallophosphoesterase family protein [Clostridium cibarium]MBD7911147.1 metallophosphoesterase family protein [Clostridium cibarium]